MLAPPGTDSQIDRSSVSTQRRSPDHPITRSPDLVAGDSGLQKEYPSPLRLRKYQYMDTPRDSDIQGAFTARYLAFLETITRVRPSLHRYCSRMTGSVLDGEDLVQETLFQAYRKLDTFDDSRPLTPWLFRIAHNRCVDFLRRRGVRQEAEAEAASTTPESVVPVDPVGPALGHAVENLVLALPPKERACVLLKDVFDYTLEEIAELVDSTVGGVKAARNRGQLKLERLPQPAKSQRPANAEVSRILELYVDRFNRRDWDALRELITADARLNVADRFAGPLSESPYFGNYATYQVPWRLAVGEVDGEPAVIILGREREDRWIPHGVIRVHLENQRIVAIADYLHCPWILGAARSVVTHAGEGRTSYH